MTDVYLNNRLVGQVDKPEQFVKDLISARRENKLPLELNVRNSPQEDSVFVYTEKGRARRPLLVVENGKLKITDEHLAKIEKGEMKFEDLEKSGIVEYLDVDEEENSYIAIDEKDLTPEHTHMELHPLVILGAQLAMIPYAEKNPATRSLISSKVMKQGIGVYATNFLSRNDTDSHILHYPQKPIVKTLVYEPLKFNQHPIGQNVIVAVMSNEGYNMDDAIIMNKSSVERGLFRTTFYRPYTTEELRYPGGQVDLVEIPDKDVKGYRMESDYNHLEEDGITHPEADLDNGAVVVGKTSPPRFLTSLEDFKIGIESRTETSISVKHGEKGTVDSVMVTESEEGNKLICVKLRDQKIPELGDKFSARSGQKGVIGMLYPQEDMPFTSQGVIPDVIFSPHSLPSRMTINYLIELLGGKVGALGGREIDGTTFDNESELDLRKELSALGFKDNGSETLYDGKTGRMFNIKIFVGNMYYLRLKYLVSNKIHSRSKGAIQLLTRQPTEGRARGGGLKLGEMEKDCFVAHGVALALKERFDSDKAVLPICRKCGNLGIYNRYRKKGSCLMCGEDAPITFVEMSYAFKLLLDELKSLMIYPKLKIEPKS